MKNNFLFCIVIAFLNLTKGNPFNEQKCQNQLNLFYEAFSSREYWAIKLFDTWAKIPAGLLSGNVYNIGDFDSCVKFRYDTKFYETIQGQHCHVNLRALSSTTHENTSEKFYWREFANFLRQNDLNLINGFCLPSFCKPHEVVEFLNMKFLNKNYLEAVEAQCKTNDPIEMQPIDIAAIIIFGLFLLVLIGSTLYDLYMRSMNKTPHKFWSSHSIYTNGMKLFDMTKIKSPSAINCMNGLRVLSIFWIMLGHRISSIFLWGNPKEFQEFMRTPYSALTKNHNLAVDTFLVLGAVLMTWACLRDYEKGQLNIGRMIWRRYLRYTPALAALVLFYVSFTKFFVFGPYTKLESVENCGTSWWVVLLHLQNILFFDKKCLAHSWYLSIDFQLFLISPSVIILHQKFGKKFLILPVVFTTMTIGYLIAISAHLDLRISMPIRHAHPNYVKWIYLPIQSRAGPWFIGMVLGHFMYQNRGKTFRINPIGNSILWIAVLFLQVSILLIAHYLSISPEIHRAFHIIFIAFSRNIWAFLICWIIFACQHLKTGGIIRWFLSLPQWQPIARMGLSMYILHPIYQYIHTRNQRVPMFMGFRQLIPLYLSDIVMTTVLSTIWYLAFEAPPLLLEEYFYKMWKSRTSSLN